MEKGKLLYDKHKHLLWQMCVIGISALVLLIFMNNYQTNLSNRNIKTGFDFLSDTAGFAIGQTLIPYNESSTYFGVYLVGLLNTLLATALAIVLATVIGFILGMSRLSANWIVRTFAYWYTELFRNIPPLLHVLFWYQVFFLRLLPSIENSKVFGETVFINIRGITVPGLSWNVYGRFIFITGLIITIALMFWCSWNRTQQIKKGIYKKAWIWQLIIAIVFVVLIRLFPQAKMVLPELGRFEFTSGITIAPEIIALVVALGTYSAVYIAESIRSAVEAVPRGQDEAAKSLGLPKRHRMRLVILPQALRIVIPPVTNQYLNILKNSSLGIVVGYSDLVNVFSGSTLNQVGRALEIMAITMFTYLVISIVIASLLNLYNNYLLQKGLN